MRSRTIRAGMALSLVLIVLAGTSPASSSGYSVRAAPSDFYVSKTGSDTNPGTITAPFLTIQHGLSVATVPGDNVIVRAGTYTEGVTFPASGSAGAPITLENYPGERPLISGNSTTFQILVNITNQSHVALVGFEIANLVATSPAASGAVMVEGAGTDIQVLNNVIHDVSVAKRTYANGRCIQVHGSSATTPLSNVNVNGNQVTNCTEVDGNIVEVSGNVDGFQIENNSITNGVGPLLSITGDTPPPGGRGIEVRNGIVSGNTVSNSTGRFALGIYLPAADTVQVLNNHVSHAIFGIMVTTEVAVPSRNITVSGNLVEANDKAGIWIGSPYHPGLVVDGATVTGNTVIGNGGTLVKANRGNFGVGHANNVKVTGNTFVSADATALLTLFNPYTLVSLDSNCYDTPTHDPVKAQFQYVLKTYTGFSVYQLATHQDAASTFGASCVPHLARTVARAR